MFTIISVLKYFCFGHCFNLRIKDELKELLNQYCFHSTPWWNYSSVSLHFCGELRDYQVVNQLTPSHTPTLLTSFSMQIFKRDIKNVKNMYHSKIGVKSTNNLTTNNKGYHCCMSTFYPRRTSFWFRNKVLLNLIRSCIYHSPCII